MHLELQEEEEVNASQQAVQQEHLEEEPEGDYLVRQVAEHQDQLQTDSDFIRHHTQDQAAGEPFHQAIDIGNRLDHHPSQQADQLDHQEVDQAEYQTHDETFDLPSISEAAGEKVHQVNRQAVTGFHLLDVLEDDEEEEEDAPEVEEQQVEEEAVEMQEESKLAEEISKQTNRTFEDIFNEAGSFIDEEDIFMEEYERLDDQDENDSGEGEDNDEISVVDHFKSIKFAKPIPKWS